MSDLTRRTRSIDVSLIHNRGQFTRAGDFQDGFSSDSSLLAIEVLRADGTQVERRVKKDLVQEICQCDSAVFNTAHKVSRFPIEAINQDQIEIQNTTIRGGPPMFTIGIPLEKDSKGNVTKIVLADYSLNIFKRPFTESKERTFFAIDRRGVLIGHSDDNQLPT